MSKRTSEKLESLIEVFDMANMLTAVGNYAEAFNYYQFVLREYQSREIYNNLGVTALLDALQYFSESELKFRYPMQLDLRSSAKGQGFANVRQQLVQQAILHFDAAISLDPNYAPAYLNKACAYALIGDSERAQFYSDIEARAIALKNKDTKIISDIEILLGILEAKRGNTEKAKKIFETASANGSALATINLKLLNGETLEAEKTTFGGLSKPEQIDKQNLKNLILEDSFRDLKSTTINKNIKFHQVEKQGPSSFLFIAENEKEGTRTYFHCTNNMYKGETARKIMIGSDRNAIVTAYGEPYTTIETSKGQIMVYKALIFVLGNHNKLERWIIYQKEEA
jgi:tetratricopeptide (TPR) repeat protein